MTITTNRQAKSPAWVESLGKYAVLFVLLNVLFCALLYAAGRIPQSAIQSHSEASFLQLEKEGMSPGILYDGHPRSMLDNFSESRILLYSYYMDTTANPLAFLENPGWSMPAEYYSNETMLHDFRVAVESECAPNTTYSRYFMGFRSIVRPLLALMNYMDMRQCILWVFCLLLGAVLLRMFQLTRNFWLSLSFMFAISQMNPTVISACFQYATCFLIAFTGMLIVLSARFKRFDVYMLFLMIGAVTQYLDFYTAPILTFGLPLLAYLLRIQYEQNQTRLCAASTCKLVLKCFLGWFAAYIGTWLCKLVLSELLTDANTFTSTMERIQLWLVQPALEGNYLRYVALALFYCTINIVDIVPLVAEAILFAAYLIRLFRNRTRVPLRRTFCDNAVYLLVALTPIIWMIATAKPSYEHMWFQYRGLCVSMFGLIIFMIRTAGVGTPK